MHPIPVSLPQYFSLRLLLPDLAEVYEAEMGLRLLEDPTEALFWQSSKDLVYLRQVSIGHLSMLLPVSQQLAHMLWVAKLCLDRWNTWNFENKPDIQQDLRWLRSKRQEASDHFPVNQNLAWNFFSILSRWQEAFWWKIGRQWSVSLAQATDCLFEMGRIVEIYLDDRACDDPLGANPSRMFATDAWCTFTDARFREEWPQLECDLLARTRAILEGGPCPTVR